MFANIKLNQCGSIVLLIFCLVVPCNVAILFDDFTEPISRTSGNVLYNLYGRQSYKHHILTSSLDANGFSVGLFRLLKDALRGWVYTFVKLN